MLARLAVANPTLFQMPADVFSKRGADNARPQLLRTIEGVEYFVQRTESDRAAWFRPQDDGSNGLAPPALDALDDDARVALARLNPSDHQLRILGTAAAVRRFLGAAAAEWDADATRIECDPRAVSALYKLSAPLRPALHWLPSAEGFCAEYRLGDEAVGIDQGR